MGRRRCSIAVRSAQVPEKHLMGEPRSSIFILEKHHDCTHHHCRDGRQVGIVIQSHLILYPVIPPIPIPIALQGSSNHRSIYGSKIRRRTRPKIFYTGTPRCGRGMGALRRVWMLTNDVNGYSSVSPVIGHTIHRVVSHQVVDLPLGE
jgi:hypothetical protein